MLEKEIFEEFDKIHDSLEEIVKEQKKIREEIKDQGVRIDVLYDERKLLQNISDTQAATLNAVNTGKDHDETIRKDIKGEVVIEALKTRALVETVAEGFRGFIKSRKRNTKKSWWKLWQRG
jgi:hypothetical protein